ncbi:MAG: hypothetical protein J6A01_05570, partial [Proteobacteria bacterium]|nr:hypothetical protein [Pseudomonadota bacterium]
MSFTDMSKKQEGVKPQVNAASTAISVSKNSRISAKSLFCICALTAFAAFGCNDENDTLKTNDQSFVFLSNKPHNEVTRSFAMNSRAGCALDSDCMNGMFCFHGSCTLECSDTIPCAKGTCSSHGRCMVANASQSLLRNLDDDLKEAQSSNVVEKIPGARVHAFPSETFVQKGANTTNVEIITEENYGPISYTITDAEDDTISNVVTVEPEVDESTGIATYTIEVGVEESSLGEQGSTETVVVDTSVGSYEVTLVPEKP